jgi:hypothetical protein
MDNLKCQPRSRERLFCEDKTAGKGKRNAEFIPQRKAIFISPYTTFAMGIVLKGQYDTINAVRSHSTTPRQSTLRVQAKVTLAM